MPSTPISCKASFTESSLEVWITASTFVIAYPSRTRSASAPPRLRSDCTTIGEKFPRNILPRGAANNYTMIPNFGWVHRIRSGRVILMPVGVRPAGNGWREGEDHDERRNSEEIRRPFQQEGVWQFRHADAGRTTTSHTGMDRLRRQKRDRQFRQGA